MVFSSLLFLFRFLPVVLIIYFLCVKITILHKFKNAILFISSLVFYAWGEPVYVVIMLFSTLVDFVHGKLVKKFKDAGEINKAKICVASSMIINLSLLGFFKYADFLIGNINAVFGSNLALLNLALPIGISFYTFQTMSYTIDIYRGQADVQNNIISFGAYVALFPQLIAGPIVQYKTIARQLIKRRESIDQFSYGIMRFMSGLGKKVLLANNIGVLWTHISTMDVTKIPVLTAWLGIIAFTFQIYFDFSGYSDMAIGLGNMFGFRFLENFRYPYISKSITEFWRRWHISLSSWFKEYVYIPLGGNRKGKIRQFRNIAVVWLLTGFWHGASWNFVMWGVYFGILLIVEKLFLLKYLEKLPAFLRHIYAMFFVIVSWAIFAFDHLGTGIQFIRTMFGLNHTAFLNSDTIYFLGNYMLVFVILLIGCTEIPKKMAVKFMKALCEPECVYDTEHENSIGCGQIFCMEAAGGKYEVVRGLLKNAFVIFVFVASVAYLVDASYNPFLYFRF